MTKRRRRTSSLPAALLASSVLAGCGGSSPTPAPASSAPTTTSSPSTAVTTANAPPKRKPRRKPKRKPRPKPNPGALPQTHQLPSAGTAAFHAEMAALWRGVRTNSVTAALPAFFPEAAYVQVKRIADPQGDWTDRLAADYRLDLAAAHALLGSHPAGARLLEVEVPQSYAHWVPPDVCYNDVGYYEVPNARVVYRQEGAVRSFGIASMISWRGVWYVVHLGAVVRPTAEGLVDDASSGAGQSQASSTC